MYFEVNKNTGEEEALKFINNVFNIVIVLKVDEVNIVIDMVEKKLNK